MWRNIGASDTVLTNFSNATTDNTHLRISWSTVSKHGRYAAPRWVKSNGALSADEQRDAAGFEVRRTPHCAYSPLHPFAGSWADRGEAAACEKICESGITTIAIPLGVDREEHQVHVARGVGAIQPFEGSVRIP